jgi:arginyl-tRNA synthetase
MGLEEPPVTMEDLDRLYPAASARMKEDESYRDRARKATAELQKGRLGYLALHRHFWKVSQFALEREFNALNIRFDLWKGESDVNYLIDDLVADLTRREVAVPSEGAMVIQVAREGDKTEIPPLLLVSSEGSAMYGTTDLATIVERKREVNPDLYWYVVDQRQALHFVQVFRAAIKAGYCTEEQLEHLGFGTMNGPDGKPFKTREGGVVKLNDLIATCTAKALNKMLEAGIVADADDEEKATTALAIGTAALKFADLANHRSTNYIFDFDHFDRFTSFEGKTGPYLQMQAVRAKAILRKAAGFQEGRIQITQPQERELLLVLDAFPGALSQAFEKRAPNFLADHLHILAQAFASFFAGASVLHETDEQVRASRLRLVRASLRQLEIGLDILGITVPERM